MTNAKMMKAPAKYDVDFERKSDARRTPNTVPILLPPNPAASPPPLLFCIRMMIIKRTEIIISSRTKNVYIVFLNLMLYVSIVSNFCKKIKVIPV